MTKRSSSGGASWRRGRYLARSNVELKWFDTIKASTQPSNSGTLLNGSLNLIAQGTDQDDRVGRKVTVKSVELRGQTRLLSNNNAAALGDHIRVVVFIDHQHNQDSTGAAWLDIFDDADINSFRRLDNEKRFTLLVDKVIDLNAYCALDTAVATVVSGEVIKSFHFWRRCDCQLEFSGTSGAITELTSNNIGVIAIADGISPYIGYTARIRYTDQ